MFGVLLNAHVVELIGAVGFSDALHECGGLLLFVLGLFAGYGFRHGPVWGRFGRSKGGWGNVGRRKAQLNQRLLRGRDVWLWPKDTHYEKSLVRSVKLALMAWEYKTYVGPILDDKTLAGPDYGGAGSKGNWELVTVLPPKLYTIPLTAGVNVQGFAANPPRQEHVVYDNGSYFYIFKRPA